MRLAHAHDAQEPFVVALIDERFPHWGLACRGLAASFSCQLAVPTCALAAEAVGLLANPFDWQVSLSWLRSLFQCHRDFLGLAALSLVLLGSGMGPVTVTMMWGDGTVRPP